MKLPGTVGSLIPWWALLIAGLMILGLMVSLSGCASMDYEWKQTRLPAPKPWLVVKVDDADFVCRTLQVVGVRPERIFACADWTPKGCTIYVDSHTPAWAMKHEANENTSEPSHCGGWSHG